MSTQDTPEEWRPVVGWPAYVVSNRGRVKRKGQPPRRQYVAKGYPSVDLWDNYRTQRFHVHALVAEAFLGPRPPGHDLHHKDFTRTNNHVENLEYLPEATHMSLHANTLSDDALAKADAILENL